MSKQLIKLLHDDMKHLTLRSGLEEAVYDSVYPPETATDEEINILFTWLQELRDGPYAAVEKVWNLHTPGRWAYLEMMGASLEEMRLLQAALNKLKHAWRRPYVIKEKKDHTHRDS